ncbi:MAG: hypothetical protein ALECFALPRED_008620 [Alectoria fallacina]|uniref:protein-ribulosamine 3-kinase n=1 Tax=Alectoria fallacina TaxID=1903189 RepID=A0A8H3EZH2_9LECA|nr:MAG: hypothetical protein ALECFALPRED_008620 [Alectoria fallacina]
MHQVLLIADQRAELPPGSTVLSVTQSGKSDWVETVRIEARHSDGSTKLYFMKSQSGELGRKMVEGTYHSERTFYSYLPDNVPKSYAWGSFKSDPSIWFYLCDFHDMTDEVPEYRKFVSLIAKVHSESMGKKKQYGFDFPTHLANIPNDNTWQSSWEIWFAQAMKRMFQIEETAHGKDDELDALKEAIIEKVIPRLLRPLETGGRSIKPCLIHSDLWPGNTKPDVHTGEILIFDSCAFWGHNEADLGTWSAPRYRMGRPFLEEYQRIMGRSEPQGDWDDRNALYALRYDLLVSALFPKTEYGYGFRKTAKSEMKRLVEKHPDGLKGFEEH